MAPPKKLGLVRHLHIDPYVRVQPEDKSLSFGGDKRLDKFLAWWDSLPPREATRMAFDLLIAACNGELGVAYQPTSNLTNEEEERAEAALDALLKNMKMDEED